MSRRLARRATLALAATAVTAATAFGCGTANELSARQELSSSLGSLDDRSSLTMSVTVDATAERLVEVAAAEGGTLPLEQAELLTGSSLVITIASQDGTPLGSLADDATPDVRLAVETPAGELADLRVVAGDLYGRVDVPAIAGLAGQPAPTVDQLGIGGVPGLEFLGDALAGGWLLVDGEQLEQLGEAAGGTTQEEEASEPDQSTIDQLRQKASHAFDRTVEVTEDGSDPELGDRILLKASPRRLLEELPAVLEGIDTPQGDAGEVLRSMLDEELGEVRDEPVTVAVYTRDGRATGVRLDLGQFSQDGKLDDVGLLVRFTTADEAIEVPTGATAVDVAGLAQLFFAQMMGAMEPAA